MKLPFPLATALLKLWAAEETAAVAHYAYVAVRLDRLREKHWGIPSFRD